MSYFFVVRRHPGHVRGVIYVFCRVVFGLNASPFLLNETLRHHIIKYAEVNPAFGGKLIKVSVNEILVHCSILFFFGFLA